MSLESIVTEVLRQGQAEADKIRKDSGKDSLNILSQAEEQVKKMTADAKLSADRASETARAQMTSSAELEAEKAVLRAKADSIDAVKKDALERLRTLPILERERYLKRLLVTARNIIPEGTVRCRKEDLDIVKMNMGNYKLGKEADIIGGIMVDSTDRKKRLDLSFETLFEDIWDASLPEISSTLFGEAGE